MIPLFGHMRLARLFPKLEDYEYIVLLIYGEGNAEFRKKFRQKWRDFHFSVDQRIGLLVLDDPHEKWVQDNLDHFLHYSKNVGSDRMIMWNEIIELLNSDRSQVNEWIKSELAKPYNPFIQAFKNMFGLNDEDLPVVMAFPGVKSNSYLLKNNIGTVAEFSSLVEKLKEGVKAKDFPFNLPSDKSLQDLVHFVRDYYVEGFWDLAEEIQYERAKKEAVLSMHDELLQQCPVFADLNAPSKFKYTKDLLKCLVRNVPQRYQAIFVEKLNLFFQNRNHNSLQPRRIRGFHRIAITDYIKAHYFLAGNDPVFYFVGDHDFYLRDKKKKFA